MTTVKITELSDIGANLASSTVIPVVNMAGTPITQKTNVGNIANIILEGAGVDYPEATVALLAQTVSNAAQPNITSVGTLTNIVVSGNATVNGNITSNGTAYVGNLSTTGLASITTLDVGTSANLGSIANVIITGGTIGQILSTDGEGNLSWTSDATTYGNSNVVTLLSAFGSNTITTTGNISGGNLVTGGEVVSAGNVSSGTGLSTGGFLSVDGATDLHDTTVTGNLSATGNITANNLGNISAINLTGSNSNVLYGNGVFAAVAGAGGLPLANGSSNFNIATSGGNVTIDVAGLETWTFDTNGNLTIPGSIVGTATIDIDNRATGNGADINLYSADDILIQARDRDIGSTSEGGDINIFAGDSAEDSDNSGGDVVIEAGDGGAANLDFGGDGGFIRIEAGRGGNAVGANYSALSGGSLTLRAGDAGTNNGNIDLGDSGGDVYIEAGDSTGNGDPGGSIILTAGTAGANALAGQIQLIIPGGDVGAGGTWTFDGAGIIQLPNSGTISNDGNNIDIGSTSAISLEASSAVNIYTDTGTNAWQWQFQDDGNLRLPTIELDVGNTINEQTVIQSQRKIIPGLRYSAVIVGTTPTVVYTATSVDTTSMKVTMQIQHTGLGMEFFDVSATYTGGNTYYTVSNRLQPPTITDSTVVVDLNGSNTMDITVTINSGAANSWVTYDATEFGIAVD
jgi:hypothetical protein